MKKKNKIHWNSIQNAVGTQTARIMKELSGFYCRNKVSDFFNKTDTLIMVGKKLNITRKALFITCPPYNKEYEEIKDGMARTIDLDFLPGIPKRFLDFKNSGLLDLLTQLEVEVRVMISTKEFVEIGRPLMIEIRSDVFETTRKLICDRYNLHCVVMSKEDVLWYEETLPDGFQSLTWRKDFRGYEAKLGLHLADKTESVLIQTQPNTTPPGQSFVRELFLHKAMGIIGYRRPKEF